MKKPNFFIVGAPKCGTTALAEYLNGHPNIFISFPKEPWYFDKDLKKFSPLTHDEYLSLFEKAEPNIHLAVGEGSTSYLFSKEAAKGILEFDPGAKFIVMLRDPIDLVQAFHSQLVFSGAENIDDFEEAWKAQEARRKNERMPIFCAESKYLLYSEWGLLGEQVERLFSIADKKNIKIILFEDFIKDTKAIYEEVLNFLRVPSDRRLEFPRVNENKKVRSLWFQQALAIGFGYWLKLKKMLGLNFKLGITGKIHSLNTVPGRRSPLSNEFQVELAQFYHDDVLKLSKLLSRDLSHWISKKHS